MTCYTHVAPLNLPVQAPLKRLFVGAWHPQTSGCLTPMPAICGGAGHRVLIRYPPKGGYRGIPLKRVYRRSYLPLQGRCRRFPPSMKRKTAPLTHNQPGATAT